MTGISSANACGKRVSQLLKMLDMLRTILFCIFGVDSLDCTRVSCAGETSGSLQVTQIPLLSSRECRIPGLTSWNICAGYLEGGAGACQVLHLYV